ncbi:MAG: hypothetical protein ACYC6Y_23535 [Thermoguttaceae bacterium]
MPDLEAFGSIPRALVATCLLLAAAAGTGTVLLSARDRPCRCRWDSWLLQVIVGLNLVGFLGILLGSTRLLSAGRSTWLLAVLAILPLLHSLRGRVFAAADPRPPIRRPTTRSELVLAALAVAAALLSLAPALCPPSGWDELVYHEVLPRRWLAAGHPAFYLDLPYSGFPSMGEILFWLAAPIEDVIAPRLLSWTCWMLALLCLYRLLRSFLRPAPAAILTMLFPLSETGLLVAENCYVETILMMNVAAMLLAGISLRREGIAGSWRLLVILGVLAGGSAAVKLTGVAAVLVPCLWFGHAAWRRRADRPAVLRSLAFCLLTALIVAFPFYLRPWLATGNPFYPYFAPWFTSDPAVLEMSRHHHLIGGATFGLRGFSSLLTAPWLLAFSSEVFDGRFGWQLLGLLVLAALAVASLRRRRFRLAALWPAAVAAWFYLFWFFTAQQARFALPAVLALAVLAAAGLHGLRGRRRQLVLAAMVVASLASVPWPRAGYYWYSLLAATGGVTRADYVHNMTDRAYLPLVQAIEARTPRNARILLLFEHRQFYIPRNCVIGTPLFQQGPFTPPDRYASPAQIVDVLRREQITHVVLPSVTLGPDQTDDWLQRQRPFLAAIDACALHGPLQPLWKSDTYLLLGVQNPDRSVSIP